MGIVLIIALCVFIGLGWAVPAIIAGTVLVLWALIILADEL